MGVLSGYAQQMTTWIGVFAVESGCLVSTLLWIWKSVYLHDDVLGSFVINAMYPSEVARGHNSTFKDFLAKSSGRWSNFIHGTGEYL